MNEHKSLEEAREEMARECMELGHSWDFIMVGWSDLPVQITCSNCGRIGLVRERS